MKTSTKVKSAVYKALNENNACDEENLSFIIDNNYYNIVTRDKEHFVFFDGTEYPITKEKLYLNFAKVIDIKKDVNLVIIHEPVDIDKFLTNTDCSFTQVYDIEYGFIIDVDGYSLSLCKQYWLALGKEMKDSLIYGCTSKKTGKHIAGKSLTSLIKFFWDYHASKQ